MSGEPKKFWMVYGVGQGAPTMQHENEAVACREAHRLARNHPGIEFYVLESMARAVKDEVRFERLKPSELDDGIPF